MASRSRWHRWPLALGVGGALTLLASTAHADVGSDLGREMGAALESGSIGLALGIAFLGGVLTSLTPCVYPMIVITVSVFGARQAKSRLEGALLSSAFVLGIATLFTPLGIIAAIAGGVHGAQLGNPWVVFPLAILFVALALSMFGAFELNLPPAMQNRLAQVGGAGYRGSFLLGLVSGIVAAPCTGPVLLALLGWVGTSGNVAMGGASLFVYALGLGLLFWVVGTFAVSLPKSGRWLEWVKSFFGVVLLVMALYYIRPWLPLELPAERTTAWIGIAIGLTVVGLVVGAIHLSYHGTSWLVRARKTIAIAMAVVGAFAGVEWIEALPPGAKIEWMQDYKAAMEKADAQDQPLLVDFGAEWCGACGELDRHTFSDPRVVSEAQKFVPVRIDMTDNAPAEQKILARYDQQGLPLVVLHDRQGEEAARVTTFVEADEFLDIMRRVD